MGAKDIEDTFRYIMDQPTVKLTDNLSDGPTNDNWNTTRQVMAAMVDRLEDRLARDDTFSEARCRGEIGSGIDQAKTAVKNTPVNETESAYDLANGLMYTLRAMLRVTSGE